MIRILALLAAPPNGRAYFGEPAAQCAERSPGLTRAWQEAGRAPGVEAQEGDGHISEILNMGTTDTGLTAPLPAFLQR